MACNSREFTVDTVEDYEFAAKLVEQFSHGQFTVDELLKKVK